MMAAFRCLLAQRFWLLLTERDTDEDDDEDEDDGGVEALAARTSTGT